MSSRSSCAGAIYVKLALFGGLFRSRILLSLLGQFGIEEERCRFDYVSAGEVEKFVRMITEFVAATKAAGSSKFRNL